MGRTPNDLALLLESILTPQARSRILENAYGDTQGIYNLKKSGWESIRVGFLPITWGTSNVNKWGAADIVCNILVQALRDLEGVDYALTIYRKPNTKT